MKENHVTDLLPEYLEGELNGSQTRTVEEHLQHCKECKEELRDFKILSEAFNREKEIEPSARLRTEFLKNLEAEKGKISGVKTLPVKKNRFRDLMKIAAVISLLLCSYILGKYQTDNSKNSLSDTSEFETDQEEMLSLLENTSASKRIKGVNYFEDIRNPDPEIIEALTERMLNDENENVRLAAVEALSQFTTSEEVKDSFIKALKSEKAPVIQIAIIQTLVKIQEKKAVAPMKELLEENSTEPFVKEQIEALLPSIT